jgi:hypothetical protein
MKQTNKLANVKYEINETEEQRAKEGTQYVEVLTVFNKSIALISLMKSLMGDGLLRNSLISDYVCLNSS